MRRVYITFTAALAIAFILAIAAAGLRHERARLLADYATAQEALAREVAGDLEKEFQDLDEDARLVANVVQRTPMQDRAEDSAKAALLRSAFEALAAVVRHYRLVGLFGPDGPRVVAPDPSEHPDTVRDFLAWSADAAKRAHQANGPVLEGPRETSTARQFYVYAFPLRGREVVVLVWEARLFLQMVLRPRPSHVRYFVLDPGRTMWVGCGQPPACRGLPHEQWSAIGGLRPFAERLGAERGTAWGADQMAASLGLPQHSAVVAWHRVIGPDRRSWTLGAVVSATTLDARERSLMKRLLMASLALILSLTTVAALVHRHLRRTTVLRERLRTAQEIAHLRERSEKILENVPVGLLGIARDGSVALVNRFLQDRVGQVKLGAALLDAFPAAARRAAATLQNAFQTAMREPHPGLPRGEELLLSGSKPSHFVVRVIPFEQQAEDVCALVMMEDFSEIKSLERQLIRAEKLVTTGVLTAGLAHEIGTPLTIIRGCAETRRERVTDPEIAADLDSIMAQIDQISATIRQVLDFSRAQPVELRPTDVHAAVTVVLNLLDWRFRQKALRVSVEGEAEPAVLIAADPDQLQQVLVNLLMNAADACTDRGSIVVRLSSSASAATKMCIEIIDDGVGVPAEHINAVFDPFFTTKKRGEGTGLGLPVVASIVRNHQGEISLSSEAGRGTTVTVLWPTIAEDRRRDD